MNIAILHSEDRTGIGRVVGFLVQAGHACTTCASAQAFLDQHAATNFDLLIIDSSLPGRGVEALLGAARATGRLPALWLTEDSFADPIIAALAAGADDYLLKPVRRTELIARVGVLLSRAWPEKRAAAQLRVGGFVFDDAAGRLALHGRPVDLTRKEFDLALLFFRNLGRPLSRATLREAIWPREAGAPSRTVDTHVSRVRSKLGLQSSSGFRLVPVYAYGYLLERLED